jgi:hypothetical protein
MRPLTPSSRPQYKAGIQGVQGFAAIANMVKQSITLSHMRSHGCRTLLIYCGAINCDHSSTLNADHLPVICLSSR